MRKKLAALATAVVTLVNCFVFDAAAEDKGLTLGLDYKTGTLKSGETVTVSLNFQNNPGLSGWRVGIEYDSDVFEYTGSTVGVFGSGTLASTVASQADPFVFLYADLESQADSKANGTAGTVTFKVKDHVPGGYYSFDLTYIPREFFNVYREQVEVNQVTTPDDSIYIPCSHKLKQSDAVEANCTTPGVKECYFCEWCGRYFSDSEGKNEIEYSDAITPPTPHTFTAEKTLPAYLKSEATCASPAVYYKSCSVCGARGTETFEYGEADASKHSYTDTYVPPVGTAKGYVHHECEFCHNSYDSDIPSDIRFMGDVDGDGFINRSDVTFLARYVAKWENAEEKVDLKYADLDGGGIGRSDVTVLSRYVSRWGEMYDAYIVPVK
ncbi:MAG: hypothetical protein IJ561_00360 [Ruminococcus sp.]|nr:hypothetical protein [Ruminococcus sp.]